MEHQFNPRNHQQRSSNAQDSWTVVAGGAAIAIAGSAVAAIAAIRSFLHLPPR